MAADRKQKTACVNNYRGSYDVEMDIDSLIADLQKERDRLTAEGWTKIHLRLDEEEYSDRRYVYMYGDRLETQEEADARAANEQKWKRLREEQDRRDYERLQAKFG